MPRRKDFLVFGSPLIEEVEIAEVVATLRSGWIGTGPKVLSDPDVAGVIAAVCGILK
jgi:hypothetical protein